MKARVRSFTTQDVELNRKLVQLEDTVFDLFQSSLDANRLSIPAPVSKAGTIVRPGQFVRAIRAVELILAAPTPDDSGLPLVVWNQSGGTVTLRALRGKVNGSTTASLAGARAYRLQHDGTDYAGEF